MELLINLVSIASVLVALFLIIMLITEFFTAGGVNFYYKKIHNWWIIKRCRAKNHKYGFIKVIDKTPTTDWDAPRCGQAVRNVTVKLKCTHCQTIFIRNNMWDYKWVDEDFNNV